MIRPDKCTVIYLFYKSCGHRKKIGTHGCVCFYLIPMRKITASCHLIPFLLHVDPDCGQKQRLSACLLFVRCARTMAEYPPIRASCQKTEAKTQKSTVRGRLRSTASDRGTLRPGQMRFFTFQKCLGLVWKSVFQLPTCPEPLFFADWRHFFDNMTRECPSGVAFRGAEGGAGSIKAALAVRGAGRHQPIRSCYDPAL